MGTAADVTGIGALLEIRAQEYGICQIITGAFLAIRDYEQLDEAWRTRPSESRPLHSAEDIELDRAPGSNWLQKLPWGSAVMSPDGQRGNSVIGGMGVLLLRGVLLWAVVPVAALVWPIAAFRLRCRGVKFSRYLGWVDLNLIAFLQRTILRPLVRAPARWVPVRDMAQVTHRLRAVDPA